MILPFLSRKDPDSGISSSDCDSESDMAKNSRTIYGRLCKRPEVSPRHDAGACRINSVCPPLSCEFRRMILCGGQKASEPSRAPPTRPRGPAGAYFQYPGRCNQLYSDAQLE